MQSCESLGNGNQEQAPSRFYHRRHGDCLCVVDGGFLAGVLRPLTIVCFHDAHDAPVGKRPSVLLLCAVLVTMVKHVGNNRSRGKMHDHA